MSTEKLSFLTTTFPNLVRAADPKTNPAWGKMNLQQMVEHMSESIRIANGKLSFPLMTPEERVPAMVAFVRSEKEFKPNTKNALMGEEPEPLRQKNMEDALAEYQTEIQAMKDHFEKNSGTVLLNPFFGELDFNDWIQLLHLLLTTHFYLPTPHFWCTFVLRNAKKTAFKQRKFRYHDQATLLSIDRKSRRFR